MKQTLALFTAVALLMPCLAAADLPTVMAGYFHRLEGRWSGSGTYTESEGDAHEASFTIDETIVKLDESSWQASITRQGAEFGSTVETLTYRLGSNGALTIDRTGQVQTVADVEAATVSQLRYVVSQINVNSGEKYELDITLNELHNGQVQGDQVTRSEGRPVIDEHYVLNRR